MKPFHSKMTEKSPMYIYATEMVSSYYSCVGLGGKRVLSIVGSGDQIINAYFFGAKEVIGFDINKHAFFILDLKISAVNKLNYHEFLEFFGNNLSDGCLSFNLYIKLRNSLSLKTRNFFDKIYKDFNNNGKNLIKSEYFHQRHTIKASAHDINAYLEDEKEYLKCKIIMQNKKINFFQSDINDIDTEKNKMLKGKFDIINLSNVLNYLTGNTAEDSLLEVLSEVTKKVSKKISKNGLFFYYSYSPSTYNYESKKIPPASRKSIINSIKKINNLKILIRRFKGVNTETFDKINIFMNQ